MFCRYEEPRCALCGSRVHVLRRRILGSPFSSGTAQGAVNGWTVVWKLPRGVWDGDRVRGEFLEMPGLRLTMPQARRLWGLEEEEMP